MTDWNVQPVDKLISQIKKEVERISNLPMHHNYNELIFISRNLYEELVELLNPYKIDDDMPPATTLKMVLKYSK